MSGVPLFNLAPNLTVSRLCLGSMSFGEQNTLAESFQLMDQAFHAGINFFDSAEMYPVPQRAHTCGRSEECLGRWISQRKIPRDSLVIATKVAGPSGQMTWIRGGPKCLDAANITEAIDNSLLRMQMDYIDLYQIHWPDRYVPMFGETEYDPVQQYASISIDEQLEALSAAVKAGKASGKYSEGESRYNLSKKIIKAATMEYLDIAKTYGLHPVSLAIAFVLRHPLVASAVFGATKSWQLQEVLNACKIELASEVIEDINKIHLRFPNPCP
ncbi:hypothetical protein JHK82_021164 [Glycine max]|nr:hypothetical protein JHK86_021172 [Glycine max]KAG5136433.1 hypothetical protein JHK82_021164 [Glycine max]